MDSCLDKQDLSDILAKDLGKRLIEKDKKHNHRKLKKFRKDNDNEELEELKLNKKTPDEIVASTIEQLVSLNDLLNHALDKRLGLNETINPLNLVNSSSSVSKEKSAERSTDKLNDKSTDISNDNDKSIEKSNSPNVQQTSNQNQVANDDHVFKVPKLPKRLCKHKKAKESSAKNLVDKLVESQLINDESIVENLIKEEIIDKQKKKRRKDEKGHKCSKHRKRKELDDLKSDKKTEDNDSPDSSIFKECGVEDVEDDDFFHLKEPRRTDDYYKDDHYNYHEDERYYSNRSSSSKRSSSYYDQLDNRHYSEEDYGNRRKYELSSSSKYYNKSRPRYYDEYDREYDKGYDRDYDKGYDREYNRDSNRYNKQQNDKDLDKFDIKDPTCMKKLRAENSISNWTKFCSRISREAAIERDDDDKVSICSGDFYSDDDDKRSIISERILNRDSLKSREIKFEIRDFKSKQARSANEIKQELMQQFPVSFGINHWKEVEKPADKNAKKEKKLDKKDPKEQELEDKVNDFLNKHKDVKDGQENAGGLDSGFDIGSIMSQRLSALKVLEKDENNITALNQLREANNLINEWSLAKSASQLESTLNANQQTEPVVEQPYESYKDFTKAAKSKDGIGALLLQKMGWQPGQGLGKNNEGCLEPIIPELKLDTKGLITSEEKNAAKIKNNVQGLYNIPQIGNMDSKNVNQNQSENLTKIANQSIVNGKHPVNILQEVCSKRKWKQPTYTIINEDGPAHKKNFLIKCTLNNVDYIPSFSSPNKKLAKAISAIVCLNAFGLMNNCETS